MRTDTAQIEHHKAVQKLLSLAPRSVESPELGDLIEEAYLAYAAGQHPQPVLKNAALLQRLGVDFLRSGRLVAAQDVVDRLLEGRCFSEEVRKLLNALANRLQSAGHSDRAERYRNLVIRFPKVGSP